ncbi:MAG TPA: hypothetical protein VGF98_05515 [Candidatus Tumulicola sp.]
MLGRALTDESLSIRTRLVLIFGGFYAQMLSRIAEIHRSQIGVDFKTIRFGDVWLQLPEPVPDLLRRQFSKRPQRDPANPYLFASSEFAGRPLRITAMRSAIPPELKWRDIRTSAMLGLLRNIEAPMLARLLGISLETALKWAALGSSPSWDKMLRLHRDLDGIDLATITIADRVAADYAGTTLPEEDRHAKPLPFLSTTSLSDEDFSTFRFTRIAEL